MTRKPSENIGPKGENWSKFLKELGDPQFVANFNAILDDDPAQRINRTQARKMGEHSAEDLREKIFAKRKELYEFREFTCGKWVHQQMKEHFPEWLMRHTIKHGPKLARVFGWYYGADHGPRFVAVEGEMPKMCPSTRVFLARRKPYFWFPHIEPITGNGGKFIKNTIRFTFWGPFIIKSEQVYHWQESEDK